MEGESGRRRTRRRRRKKEEEEGDEIDSGVTTKGPGVGEYVDRRRRLVPPQYNTGPAKRFTVGMEMLRDEERAGQRPRGGRGVMFPYANRLERQQMDEDTRSREKVVPPAQIRQVMMVESFSPLLLLLRPNSRP